MWKPTIWARETLLSFTLAYGKLPEHWWAMWKDRESFFSEDGVLTNTSGVPVRWIHLEEKINSLRRRIGDDDEYAWFHRLMMEIFKLDPNERMPANQVVQYLPSQWHEMEKGEWRGVAA
jgi:hypothetical protein